MKVLCALLFSFMCLPGYSQNNNWFKGTWYGIRTFPSAESTIGIPVRLEVSSVRNNNFTARLIYMFPSDTSARLIIKLQGIIKGSTADITKSSEIYLQHTLLREIWRECSGCAQKIVYGVDDNKVMMKIEHSNCSDSCNGESVFYKRFSEFDSVARVTILKNINKVDSLPATKSKLVVNTNATKAIDKTSKDSVAAAIRKAMTMDSLVKKKTTEPVIKRSDSIIKKNIPADTVAGNKAIKPLQKKPVSNSQAIILHAKPYVMKDTVPLAIAQRVTQLINTYQVSSPHINVQLFDNGEIDYDAVSVYYNGKLIINNKTLTHKAITFSLEASAVNRHHEFTLIAETEGMIPPNTALLRITAGSQHFELEVSSSSQRNAKIAIDYTGE